MLLDANAMLGSLDVITGKPMHGDRILPVWLENGVESSLRDTEDDIAHAAASLPASARQQQTINLVSPAPSASASSAFPSGRDNSAPKDLWTDLDKFYEDEDSESEDEDESEEEDEEDVVNLDSEPESQTPDDIVSEESSDENTEKDEQ